MIEYFLITVCHAMCFCHPILEPSFYEMMLYLCVFKITIKIPILALGFNRPVFGGLLFTSDSIYMIL